MTTRLLLATSLVLALAACGRGDKNSNAAGDVGGTVVISVAGEPDFLIQPLIINIAGKMTSDLIFERLAEIGPKLNTMGDVGFEPRLARHWTWAPDSLSIAFELDPRARWHDGRPVRAEDVKMGYELIADPKVGSPNAPNVAEVDSVTVRDSLTAVFWYHRRSLDQFFTAAYNVIPLPAHLLKDADRANLKAAPIARAPVGSGQFRFVRWVPSQLIELVADTANFRGRPKLDRVVVSVAPDPNTAVTRLLAGEADFYEVLRGEQLEQAAKSPNLQVVPYGGLDYAFLQFNLRDPKRRGRAHPVLGDHGVRLALAMAIDRAAIVKNLYDTLAAVPFGPAPRSLGIADTTIRQTPYDTARAKRMLDSLGWRDTNGDGVREKNGVSLRFGLMIPGSSRPRQRAAVLLQEQLKRVGADVTIDQVEVNTMIARITGRDFDAVINSWHPDPTPSSIRQTWTTEASRAKDGSNFGSYESREFDARIDSAIAAHDVEAARALYRRAYQTFVDDVPAVLLYEPNLVAGASKRIRLSGLRPDAWWVGIPQWWIPANERIDRDRIGLRQAAR
ncbi:MAG TPA: peptide ABC transporter substrate-binding protein [Gemmatimonadaceae bacterium]|nr:peptide ABC transporter substrate-binding protein [Gemmatimonadaceae bacterium]